MTIDRRSLLGGAAATIATAAAPLVGAAQHPLGRARKFLWGAATAAHQIEGGNVNSDYWVLEHIPATYFKEPSGDACDSYHRWREDLALVRAGGMNAYRFSVEWARIEPERGEFSQAALDHYRRIFVTAREMDIEPVVTFHHFTSPRWVAAHGGWENPRTADDYARYAEKVTRSLGGTIGWACTMNEPNAQVTSKVMALDKPWDKEPAILAQAAKAVGSDRWGSYFLGNPYKVRDVCIDAHRKGRIAIKSVAPHVQIGMTLALQQLSAGPGGEALYRRVWENARRPFYEVARGDDFIGIQTYNRGRTGPAGYLPNNGATMVNMWGEDASPEALGVVAEEAHNATGCAVLVTENGLQTIDDRQRIEHMQRSVAGLAERIELGLPVLGYIHWSLLDNFEWSSGYVPRFGLVAVERTSFRRTPKPSLSAFRDMVKAMRARHSWA